MSWRSDRPKPSSPSESGKGIKAHSKRGAFAENWWAQRWIGALERVTDAGRLRRGQSYARKGQVLSIDEKAGVIAARVQGSRPTPYKVTIRLAPFTDVQWQAVIDGLAARAIFSAQLLAGEMPHEIEEAFSAAGLSLFPAHAGRAGDRLHLSRLGQSLQARGRDALHPGRAVRRRPFSAVPAARAQPGADHRRPARSARR